MSRAATPCATSTPATSSAPPTSSGALGLSPTSVQAAAIATTGTSRIHGTTSLEALRASRPLKIP